jgi:hypothetical protein
MYHTQLTALGNFIHQNYQQALEKIQYNREKLAVLSAQLEMTSADYKSDLQSEHNYLKSLQMEPIEITQTINYMELGNIINFSFIFHILCNPT